MISSTVPPHPIPPTWWWRRWRRRTVARKKKNDLGPTMDPHQIVPGSIIAGGVEKIPPPLCFKPSSTSTATDSTNIRAPHSPGGYNREDNHHRRGRGVGGEYDNNNDSGSLIHMMVSFCLPGAMTNIDFGDEDDKIDDKKKPPPPQQPGIFCRTRLCQVQPPNAVSMAAARAEGAQQDRSHGVLR